MSLHNNPKYQIPALVDALKQHGLKHNSPSQLADAFRTGWVSALATPAQAAAQQLTQPLLHRKEAMNTLKIGRHCPVHKGIYAGIARSFSSEPDNHIWLLDAKSPEEYMNWVDATAWAESLGAATYLPTRYEAVLLGCHLVEELGGKWLCVD